MNTKILESIGLTNSEAKVYLALLGLRSSPTGKIVDASRVASSKIYEILEKLIQKGLASYVIIKGVKHYDAASPQRILDYLEEKKDALASQEKEIEKAIPEMEAKRNATKDVSTTEVYHGMKGLHTTFYNAINTLKKHEKKEFFAMGIPKRTEKVNEFFVKLYNHCLRENISARLIFNEEARGEIQTKQKLQNIAIKYLPESSPAAINVIGDHTLIFPSEADDILVIDIHNKRVAESFRVQFERLWNQEVVTTRGIDSLNTILSEAVTLSKKNDAYRVLGASFGKGKEKKQYETFFDELHKKRLQQSIKSKILFSSESKQSVKKLSKRYYNKYSKAKFLAEKTSFPIETIIDPEQVHFAILEKIPTIISVKNKQLAHNFKMYFDQLWNQKIKTYEGKQAIRNLFTEKLSFGDYCSLGEGMKIVNTLGKKFFVTWQKEKEKRGIKGKVIIGKKYQKEMTVTHSSSEFKFIEGYENPGITEIFKDKLVVINFSKEPIAFLIEDEVIAQSHQTYFDMLWGQETFMHKGRRAVYVE